jgi:hypothetical protein
MTLKAVADALPYGCHDAMANTVGAWSKFPNAPVVAAYAWPMAFLSGQFESGYGAVRLSENSGESQEALKLAWREWLALFNRLQVLPNTFLLEETGVLHGDYAALGPAPGLLAAGEVNRDADPWLSVFPEVLSELHPGLLALRDAGLLAPDHVGFELPSAAGDVIAEAELAWEASRIVVLADHQTAQKPAWEAGGWQVVQADQEQWPMLVIEMIKESSE